MSEWLTDKEKRLLFSALTREKKVCAEVDKDSFREPYEESLVSVVESLEYKFYYDRLFKQMEKQIRADSIDEIIRLFDETWESDPSDSWVDFVHNLAKQLKEQNE